jgi:hypothetical protein
LSGFGVSALDSSAYVLIRSTIAMYTLTRKDLRYILILSSHVRLGLSKNQLIVGLNT